MPRIQIDLHAFADPALALGVNRFPNLLLRTLTRAGP